ncbi:MAG TPA: CDP-alcohol phosphatidyltransferase family protein [Candidatus Cryosericum sp.]|nr:CDP-alcohol phosphatidyltransferase family protein [Candidatus Cryosericum sp.]
MGLTLPNVLTIFRMVLIPLLITLILSNHPGWALLVFILAGVTDGLDGLVARRYKQSSRLGAFLDPTADKLLMTACFIVLSIPDHPKTIPEFEIANHIPIYLTIVTISRDVFIVMLALLMHLTSGVASFPPSALGKLTTLTQILTVGVVLLLNTLNRPAPILVLGLGWFTLALTVSSGLHYIYRASRLGEAQAPPERAPAQDVRERLRQKK